jgi:hypothetical protein
VLKKIVAILFITIYLFNLIGYSILFDYFIHQTNEQIVEELDKGNYNESELMEIKVALNLPYYTSWNVYERYDGEIELNGIHYNFVKRKVFNDTLFLLCLPNHAKTKLYKAKNEFVANEIANDPSSSSKKGMESFCKKNIIETEYKQLTFQYIPLYIFSSAWLENVFSSRLTSCFIASPAKPPEISS